MVAYPVDPLTTRSVVRRNFALLDAAGYCPSTLPDWRLCTAHVVASPEMGANFAAYLLALEPGGGTVGSIAAPAVQQFMYGLEGRASVTVGDQTVVVGPGHFVYAPPGTPWSVAAEEHGFRCVLFRRPYTPYGERVPGAVIGHEDEIEKMPFMDMPTVTLQHLLPADLSFDLMVNIFTFHPGDSHTFIETHWEQHGLFMLSGKGLYYLDDAWYPVKQGDFIWMGPYVPQAFYATGREPARYIYTKDANRDVVFPSHP